MPQFVVWVYPMTARPERMSPNHSHIGIARCYAGKTAATKWLSNVYKLQNAHAKFFVLVLRPQIVSGG